MTGAVDPTRAETGSTSAGGISWSAGMLQIGPCLAPDEPVYISGVRLSTDGNKYTILDYQDPNQPTQVTGYNVRRSSNPALPKSSWPLLVAVRPLKLWSYKV